MKGAIRKAERVHFASLLNALVSSWPPPTRPVVCMNYLSFCHKQLGNYDYDDRINKSDSENAEMGTGRCLQRCWETELGSFYASAAICCLSTFFFLSPFILDFFAPLLMSLSRTFIKGALLMVETAAGLPERLPCLHSLLPRGSLCFAAHSF